VAEASEVIIVKKRPRHHGSHGGAWKVAYADFVTAMMALFIVLWMMNASKEVQEAVGGYFKDPRGNSKMVGSNKNGGGVYVAMKKEDLLKLKEQLEKSIHRLDPNNKLKGQIEITITDEGLRIELMESEKGTFFELGSPTPTPALTELLQVLSQVKTYDNWDLSSDRANEARRLMQQEGIRADQISQVRGFADQRLRLVQNPEDPSNRRISLIVQYSSQTEGEMAPTSSELHSKIVAAPQ